MKPVEAAALLLLGMIWGSAFLMNDVVVDEVSPLTIVAGRSIISAVFLTSVVLITRRPFAPRSMWPLLIALAVLNNLLPFTLITWAQQYITSSLAATLNATMPLMTFVIAVMIASERWDIDRALGVVVGFAGAAVLIGPDLRDITSSSAIGNFAVLFASLGYAISTVLARQRLRGEPMALASGQMIFGAILITPIALAIDRPTGIDVSFQAGLAWIGLGVLSSGVAYVIFFGLVQRMAATSVSLVSYIIPVVATVLGWLVLNEAIGLNLFVGLVLIILGMFAVNGNMRALIDRWRRREVGAGAPGR